MAKSEHASAVTAIHGSDFESFAASTLFSQGWSVLYRALDWVSLNDFLQGLETQPDVLLISTDLEGLDPQSLHKLTNSGMRIFIFRKSDADLRQFPDSFAQPTVALELIAMIRGSMRRPMLKVSEPIIEANRAHVLAIAGAHAGAAGELPRPEVEPEFHGAAEPAGRHREPDRDFTARLQRSGERLQHHAAHLPAGILGEDAVRRVQAHGVVPGHRLGPVGAQRGLCPGWRGSRLCAA